MGASYCIHDLASFSDSLWSGSSTSAALILGPKVDHKNVVQDRSDEAAELFMGGMDQVIIAVLFTFERQNEAMGAAFVALFRTIVRAPLEFVDFGDLFGKLLECGDNLIDLLLGRAFLKLKSHHVPKLGLLGFLGFSALDNKTGKEQSESRSHGNNQRGDFHRVKSVINN